jgi:hypothetical protein
VRVNQGGEPGHDDYGLPSVDIQVPDDARDLYRDVQAYHRELRALRRQERSKRWRVPLRKSGLAVPVIAGFLVLAMIAGMILTMVSANPSGLVGTLDGPRFKPYASTSRGGSSNASRPAATKAPAAVGRARLPAKRIVVSAGKPFTLRAPKAAAIVVMPTNCRCSVAIRRLLTRARSVGVPVYFAGSRTSGVAALGGMNPALYKGTAVLAIGAGNALDPAYPASSLEILLVDSRGAVSVRSGLHPKSWTKQTLSELKRPR